MGMCGQKAELMGIWGQKAEDLEYITLLTSAIYLLILCLSVHLSTTNFDLHFYYESLRICFTPF